LVGKNLLAMAELKDKDGKIVGMATFSERPGGVRCLCRELKKFT
jgi:hypothetical protein